MAKTTITCHGHKFTLISHDLDAGDAADAFAAVERALDDLPAETVAAWHAGDDGRGLDDVTNRVVAELLAGWANPEQASGVGVEIVAA
jgi:hypothetical protein